MTDENEAMDSTKSLKDKCSDSLGNDHTESKKQNTEIEEETKDDEQIKEKSGTDDHHETKQNQVDEPVDKQEESEEIPRIEKEKKDDEQDREENGGGGCTKRREDGEVTKVETTNERNDEGEKKENTKPDNPAGGNKGKDIGNSKDGESEKIEVKEEGKVDTTFEKDSSVKGENNEKRSDPALVEEDEEQADNSVIKPHKTPENINSEGFKVNEDMTEKEKEENDLKDTEESSVKNQEEPGSGLIDERPGGEKGIKESPGEKEVIDVVETNSNVETRDGEDLTTEEKKTKSGEEEGNTAKTEKKGTDEVKTKNEVLEKATEDIEKEKDSTQEMIKSEVSESATKELDDEGRLDKEMKIIEQPENVSNEKTDGNQCSEDSSETCTSISTNEDGRVGEELKTNEPKGDEGSSNVNESKESKGIDQGETSKNQVEELTLATNKGVSNTEHDGGQQEMDSEPQNSGEERTVKDTTGKGTEIHQPHGRADVGGISKPEVEGGNEDGGKQSENISEEDSKTVHDTERNNDATDGINKKTTIAQLSEDATHEETVPKVADVRTAKSLDETVSDEMRCENMLAATQKKEPEQPYQTSIGAADPSKDRLTSQKDISNGQESCSAVPDTKKDADKRTEQRVGSGSIYRVQTDYLTRQVIAKQEKEIYLEEKLSETTRDLEIAERKVKDLQLRLKRFVKDDEVKDTKIRQMEKEYKDLAEQMRRIEDSLDSRSKNNNLGEVHNETPKHNRKKGNSKVCTIL